MNRRIFIKAAISSLAIPYASPAAQVTQLTGRSSARDYVFYDRRFAEARQLAAAAAGANSPIPVTGDITDVWNEELRHAWGESSLNLHGVTTESFYFCLQVMLRSYAPVEAQATRINHDLYRWTIRSQPQPATG